ncbi:hypothetical protein K1W69_15000 [Hoeflea sp. WL0058]|uniref:Uncharacterized protein n=1 Tax=Flavimaribacter sediminis TaxID=2865987 RepID=A0AAE2ZPR9_9HYPH|nr:hypothetical protein [Flavimaribacter sediminis]MBW8638502.1 hypothetical protein [Flavimaribacter sediminis]
MAQSSKPRHSKSTKKPVTIDLEPESVKSGETSSSSKAASSATTGTDAQSTSTSPKSSAASPSTAETAKSEAAKPEASATKAAADKPESKPASDAKGDAQPAAAASGSKAGASSSAGPTQDATPRSAPTGPKIGASASSASSAKSSTASSGAPPSSAAAPAGKAKSGGSGALLAGLVGGLVVLVLGGALIWSGVLSGGGSPTASAGSDLEDMRKAISDFEDQANSQISGLAKSMEDRIASLQQTTAAPSTDNSDQLQALQKQIADLSSRIKGLGTGDADAALKTQISALASAQAQLQTTLQQVQSQASALASKISALEASQSQASKALDTRLAAVEKTLSGPREDIKVARALTAANLKSAIDRGGPFMAELEAFASVEGTSPSVDQLRPLAASGVPTRAQLLSEFSSDAKRIIDAADGAPKDQNVWNRLLDSASSVVTVRPVGEVAGETPEAIVARIENRLKNGDLKGAENEWNTLPQGSKDASAAFARELKARIEANQLVATMLSGAMPVAPAASSSPAASTTSDTGAAAADAAAPSTATDTDAASTEGTN